MTDSKIIVVGAGVGGLTTAAFLAKAGRKVIVLEAREGPGGLASRFQVEGQNFDYGPYILLDKMGLEWAFTQLEEKLESHISLQRIEDVYQVEKEGRPTVKIFGGLAKTVDHLEQTWTGAGKKYAQFIEQLLGTYERLRPMQYSSDPGLRSLISHRAWREIPFLLQSLASVLRHSGLPREVSDALSIWTHIAGQKPGEAPSVLAFVPALIHHYGAFVPTGGIAEIPLALERIARAAGVEFRYGALVKKILTTSGQVSGIEVDGEVINASLVISNASGIGTYKNLLQIKPPPYIQQLGNIPLQSPGVGAYLLVDGNPRPPYLRFFLPQKGLCRLLVQPGVVDPKRSSTLRLLGPVDHAWAQDAGPLGQSEYLQTLLAESWWQSGFRLKKVITRVPVDWGVDFNLYKNSMNPVMTAKFMRKGRLAHKSPIAEGLYLAGSSTHPGQWVSFCAISGILAAKKALHA